MSTQLAVDDPALDAPVSTEPYPGNPGARYLFEHGLEAAARALDRCGEKYRFHRDEDGHAWRQNGCRCKRKCACLHCGIAIAKAQYQRLIGLSVAVRTFTYLEFTLAVDAKAAQREWNRIARVISTHPAAKSEPTIYKLVERRGQPTLKVISLAVLSILGATNVRLGARSHFSDALTQLLDPELPIDPIARAKLEIKYRGMRLFRMRGATRKRLSLYSDTYSLRSNKSAYPNPAHAPHCPKCGKPAIEHSQWFKPRCSPLDIPPLVWTRWVFVPIPEAEDESPPGEMAA